MGQGQPAAPSLTVAHSCPGVHLGCLLMNVGRAVGFSQMDVAAPSPLPGTFCSPCCPAFRGAHLLPHLPWRRAHSPSSPPGPPCVPRASPWDTLVARRGAWEQSPCVPWEEPLLARGP